jgi:hypothetical protein
MIIVLYFKTTRYEGEKFVCPLRSVLKGDKSSSIEGSRNAGTFEG